MKHSLIALAFGSLLVACSHKLDLEESQLSYVSPHAQEILKSREYMKVPSFFPISEDRIIEARNSFQQSEVEIENTLIKKFQLQVKDTTIGNTPVLIISPEDIPEKNEGIIGFNIHGGGFIMGTGRDRSALLMAGYMKIRIFSVDYSVAPEVKYPVAINECLEVYKNLVNTYDTAKMIGISSSAGGNLMVSMLLKAGQQNLPMMRAQVLFTPNTDLSFGGDSGVGNDERDFITRDMSARVVKEFYLGDADPKDPSVSPIFGSFKSDFPSSIVVSGSRDILLSSSIRLVWKLKEASVQTELLVGEGMWHGFHWDYEMPEAIAALNAVCHFLNDQLGADTSTHLRSMKP